MPSRKATGDECEAMKSPTILLHTSSTSVSCNRSFSPRRCINFGKTPTGACHRSGRGNLSGRPRHSAMTWARSDGFISFFTGALSVALFAEGVYATVIDRSYQENFNTVAACCSGECSAQCGTWRRCAAQSEYPACSRSQQSLCHLTVHFLLHF